MGSGGGEGEWLNILPRGGNDDEAPPTAADFPNGRVEKAAAGSSERGAQTDLFEARRSRGEKKAQFFIFKGPADENAAASEVNWVHNGAINCCFVALLDLANG